MPFAVIDFETTGILPSYHHRAVEIGVVHVDPDGTITGRWETLINPERDLGPQRIHGIRASDILSAPTFADIAPDLADLLRGRTVVAHNAPFDLRFLDAEFARAGYPLPPTVPSLCTMSLAANFGLSGRTSLANACAHFGIDNAQAHSAGGDAFATAQLLAAYRHMSSTWNGWAGYWQQVDTVGREYPYPAGRTTGVAWCARDAVEAPTHFLERIANDAAGTSAEGASAEYLALLDRCLLDRQVSEHEAAQLAEVAEMLGLGRAQVEELHAEYYRALARTAWDDGVLTDDERADLDAVAALLRVTDAVRVEGVSSRIARTTTEVAEPDAFALRAGDMIVLTGEMSRERSDWESELRARGLVPHPTITKKVALVVAADPDSLSGKAKKARDYGIPIVSEAGLVRLLEQ